MGIRIGITGHNKKRNFNKIYKEPVVVESHDLNGNVTIEMRTTSFV